MKLVNHWLTSLKPLHPAIIGNAWLNVIFQHAFMVLQWRGYLLSRGIYPKIDIELFGQCALLPSKPTFNQLCWKQHKYNYVINPLSGSFTYFLPFFTTAIIIDTNYFWPCGGCIVVLGKLQNCPPLVRKQLQGKGLNCMVVFGKQYLIGFHQCFVQNGLLHQSQKFTSCFLITLLFFLILRAECMCGSLPSMPGMRFGCVRSGVVSVHRQSVTTFSQQTGMAAN